MSFSDSAAKYVIRSAKGEPTLLVSFTGQYRWIYSDAGSGAHQDVTIQRPSPEDPTYSIIGDFAYRGYGPPTGAAIVVKAVNDDPRQPILMPPTGFREVWNDHGSGGNHDGSIWYAVPPDGYISIGYVVQGGYSPPSIGNYVCLRRDWVEQTGASGPIWNDEGSGAHKDVGLWGLSGVPNSFVAQPNYSPWDGAAYRIKGMS